MSKQIFYDLAPLLKISTLARSHKENISKILSCYSIVRDLISAKECLEDHLKIHDENPQEFIDDQSESPLKRSADCLFTHALISFCRAIDHGSRGRKPLDFRAHFISQGAEEIFKKLRGLRDRQYAHYDGFEVDGQLWSQDGVALARDGDRIYVAGYYVRYGSDQQSGEHLKTAIAIAGRYTGDEFERARRNLLSSTKADSDLRKAIASSEANTRHMRGMIAYMAKNPDHTGPVEYVDWTR